MKIGKSKKKAYRVASLNEQSQMHRTKRKVGRSTARRIRVVKSPLR